MRMGPRIARAFRNVRLCMFRIPVVPERATARRAVRAPSLSLELDVGEQPHAARPASAPRPWCRRRCCGCRSLSRLLPTTPTVTSLSRRARPRLGFQRVADLGAADRCSPASASRRSTAMSFCGKACSRLTRASQLSSRQNSAAAEAHRRDARHVGAVGERRAHHVELVLDAPTCRSRAARRRLALELAAAEDRVALRIDRLLELAGARIAARRRCRRRRCCRSAAGR